MSGDAAALAELHARIRGCTACPLSGTRTQAVPGDGPVSARVMAVGEAPGEKEDRSGVPFVGAAGKLLTTLLEEAGIPRSDLYITNTVKCRPPGNRDPLPAEVAACAGFLDAQLDLIAPDAVLLLGRHATARLLPDAGPIGRIHGQPVTARGRTWVPLYHPAAALYNGGLRGTLEADMRGVRGHLDDVDAERRLEAWRQSTAAAAGGQQASHPG